MFKLCLIRGCRIGLMLVLLAMLVVFIVFFTSPNVGYFEQLIESKLQHDLQASRVDISQVQLDWQFGPVVDVGKVQVDAPSFSLKQAHIQIRYPLYYLFLARFAPEVMMNGGQIVLHPQRGQDKTKATPPNIQLTLSHFNISWIDEKQTHKLDDVTAYIAPRARNIMLHAQGIQVNINLNADTSLQQADVLLTNFSILPSKWRKHVQGLTKAHLSMKETGKLAWQWAVDIEAEQQEQQGLIAVEDVHLRIPFQQFSGHGSLSLAQMSPLKLAKFEAEQLHWISERGFAQAHLKWAQDLLQLTLEDGVVDMPQLWSWLWMLGGKPWHAWLNSMHQGKVTGAHGHLSLAWKQPLTGVKQAAFADMQFQVQAQVKDADIALGLANDYLYAVDALVDVDEHGLKAKIAQADLNGGIGQVSGNYHIDWHSLLMDIDAKGTADVGKLHTWLDPASAKELHWGKAPAQATVKMKWYADQEEPDMTVVHFQPVAQQTWHLKPKGIAVEVYQGMATWDYQKGLDLSQMQASTPWFDGKLDMFLDKQQDWALDTLTLQGKGSLQELTDAFALPIVQPKGETSFAVQFEHRQWQGHVDLSQNTWRSFVGYAKPLQQKIILNMRGKSPQHQLFPIKLHQFQVHHPGFQLDGQLTIDADKLDFDFRHVETAQVSGQMRLLMPLDAQQAWGLEAKTSLFDHKILHPYIEQASLSSKTGQAQSRPWHIFAQTDKLLWDKSRVYGVQLQLSSAQHMTGELTARAADIGASHLTDIQSSFTVQAQGKVDLQVLKARGSGQLVTVSGTVTPKLDGELIWQGMVLISGKFGTLMQQAELDKLFQEGDMHTLFLGRGAFRQGEPWWRGMHGSLRLRVDDGRLMEGGTLTRLLAALSLVDLPKYLVFQRGDLIGKGLLYDRLQVEAELNEETLNIQQLVLLSSALDAGGRGTVDLASGDLDIVLVARPWQNIESFIGNIPVIGRVLTGEDKSLLRKIYRVHGPASDAKVDEVNPEDVGLPKAGYLEDLFSPSQWFKPKKKVKAKE